MEATKKKKAYLKPEMSRFEMRAESHFQASGRDEYIPIEEDLKRVTSEPSCTSRNSAKGGTEAIAKNLKTGEGSWFLINPDNSCTTEWTSLGFAHGGDVYIYRGLCNGVDAWWISHSFIDPSKIKCE